MMPFIGNVQKRQKGGEWLARGREGRELESDRVSLGEAKA